jgi:hypothetical protein
MEQLYTIFSWLSIGVTFGFGLCILLLKTPDTPALLKYRQARKVMAFAYLLLSVMNTLEIVTRSDVVDMQLTWTICLIMSAMQSFLFTYTFIILINPQFSTRKRMILESTSIALLALTLTAALLFPQRPFFKPVFIDCILYEASMLIRYTVHFVR